MRPRPDLISRPHLFPTRGVGGEAAVGNATATYNGARLLIPVSLQMAVWEKTLVTSAVKPAAHLSHSMDYTVKVVQLVSVLKTTA